MNTPTDRLRLYALPTSNSQRVAIALEELALPYDLHVLDRAKGDTTAPPFLAINPAGLAPTLVDGDLTVTQSAAILVYLAEKAHRLLPEFGSARYRTLEWLAQAVADVQATSSALFFARQKVGEPHGPTVALFDDRLLGFLRHCDDALARRADAGGHLAGDYSIADIALYPLVAPRLAAIEEHRLERLAAWARRLALRAAVARGMALSTAG